jgi:lysophospholipase L1-like esterase
MKRLRIMRGLVPVLMAAGLVFVCGCENDSAPYGEGYDFGPNNPDLYLAMGDSITAAGWPGILAGKAGKATVTYAQGGARTGTGAAAVGDQLSGRRPGYLLILYGSNDAINGADPEVSINNLRAMIQAAKANRTLAVIGTLPPMRDGHALYAGAARALSGRIRSLGGSEGVPVADVERAFGSNPDYLKPDGLHPTPAGSEVIAQSFYNALN